jgi:glycosyltransferase involved in cell wall biosynthesis
MEDVEGMNPRYSICITHFNDRPTLTDSLESILSQIDSSFEIVVVDNKSNDGSEKILESYSQLGRLKLISIRCSRGRGRQIALENSAGELVISNLDLDDVFKPRLGRMLTLYHEKCEGTLLWVRSIHKGGFWGDGSFTITPRELVLRLGGWRDLQFGEDWELVRRAAALGSYRWTDFQLLKEVASHQERKTLLGSMNFRFLRYRDMMRCGRRVFEANEHVSPSQGIPFLLAKLLLPFYQSYADGTVGSFNPYAEEFRVDFGENLESSNKGTLG